MSHYSTVNRGTAWATVLLLSALYIFAYLDRLIFSLLIQGVRADLAVSDTQVGLLVGASFASFYVLFALPMSRIADTWDRKRLIVIAAVLWNGMTAASAFAGNFPTLVLLRIGVALGEAALAPSAMSMIGDLFARETRARPISIFVGAGALGTSGSLVAGAAVIQLAQSPLIAAVPGLSALAPWRLTLLLIGVPGFLLTCIFALLAREPTRQSSTAEPGSTVADVARHMRQHATGYAAVICASCLLGVLAFAMITWYPTYLVRRFGMDVAQAGYIFGLAGLIATPLAVVAGPFLMGRVNRRGREDGYIWVGIAGAALIAPLMIGSMLAPTAVASLALAAPAYFVILAAGNLSVVVMPLLPPASMRARAMAVYMFVSVLASLGLGPLIVAVVSERLFPGPEGLGKAMTAVVAAAAPLLVIALATTRSGFIRAMGAAADRERLADTPIIQAQNLRPRLES